MKRSKFVVLFSKVFLTAAILLTALAACSSPSGEEGKAFFTINLGSSGRMAWRPSSDPEGDYPSFSELKYKLTFSSTGKLPIIIEDDLSDGTITGSIDIGVYTVSLEILLLDGYLYAQDDETHSSVEIIPNGNTLITLHMVKNEYVDGQGLEGNPFRVYDVDTLGRVGKGTNPSTWTGDWSLSAHYRQMRDITLTAPTQGGSNLTPIGTEANPFTGIYDGGGHKIENFQIYSTSGEGYIGLFGSINSDTATVQNVGIAGCVINYRGAGNYVGGVVGYINGGTVQNCYVTGEVSGFEYVGGVVGNYTGGGTVQNCYATSDVSGNHNVGGVVGYINGGTVENCYATGDVSGDSSVGGVVGNNYYGKVINCYATGVVFGDIAAGNNFGGVVGNNSGTAQNCVALNPSISGYDNVRRVASGASGGTLSSNFGRKDMDPEDWDELDGKNGADITADDWNSGITFWKNTAGFDTDVWNIANNKLPTLKNMPDEALHPQNPEIKYLLGQTGPGGGEIFFVMPEGFIVEGYGSPGNAGYFASYTAHYLEVAPEVMSDLAWASPGFVSTNITGTEDPTGKGRKNTALILAVDANAPAAKACKDYRGPNNLADWFLPSAADLLKLCLYDNPLGDNSATDTYWSSSQTAAGTAFVTDIGSHTGQQPKSNTNKVRAVRAF